MKKSKTTRLVYWITTTILFLFDGVMPALTSQTEMAKEGIRHLGYPAYFGTTLVLFKIAGSLLLIVPQVPQRLKEWAYAGFAFNFTFAAISQVAVDGMNSFMILPVFCLVLLALSYRSYHKLRKADTTDLANPKTNAYVLSGLSR
jgi:hypothetical protein